jgi:hypothetical protein
MIKASDKKTTAAAQHPSCYEKNDQPSFGIAFCRKDGTQRFALYSFLSALDFDGKRELIFRFASWIAYVRGEALSPIWNAVQEGNLAQVREVNRTCHKSEPWVRELILVETEAVQPLTGLPFPEENTRFSEAPHFQPMPS